MDCVTYSYVCSWWLTNKFNSENGSWMHTMKSLYLSIGCSQCDGLCDVFICVFVTAHEQIHFRKWLINEVAVSINWLQSWIFCPWRIVWRIHMFVRDGPRTNALLENGFICKIAGEATFSSRYIIWIIHMCIRDGWRTNALLENGFICKIAGEATFSSRYIIWIVHMCIRDGSRTNELYEMAHKCAL